MRTRQSLSSRTNEVTLTDDINVIKYKTNVCSVGVVLAGYRIVCNVFFCRGD